MADESLKVNLDEEVTFEFLLGTGQWQTSLRLIYDAVISMDLNPPLPVMQQAYSYKYRDYDTSRNMGKLVKCLGRRRRRLEGQATRAAELLRTAERNSCTVLKAHSKDHLRLGNDFLESSCGGN